MEPKCIQNRSKSCQFHLKFVQNPLKIRQNLILGGFGPFSAPNRAKVGSRTLRCESSEAKSRFFSRKWPPKGPFWEPFWSQNRSKIDAKIDTKIDAEKASENYAKRLQNDAKMEPKSMIFHTFSKKAKTLQTLCFPIYFDVLGMQNRCNIYIKSVQNRCWEKACKKYGK